MAHPAGPVFVALFALLLAGVVLHAALARRRGAPWMSLAGAGAAALVVLGFAVHEAGLAWGAAALLAAAALAAVAAGVAALRGARAAP